MLLNIYIYQIVNSSHQSFTETFITKTKVCCCWQLKVLTTESSKYRNAILIIPIYTSVYLWLRENCVLVLMETFAG